MSLLPVDEAKVRILKGVKPLGAETVALSQAAGRVLAKDVKASRDQPPFAASAMDGYAVRSEDAVLRAQLSVIGRSAAGRPYRGHVGRGEAVRISTGAPVPAGADTVVIQENVKAGGGTIVIVEPAREGLNIRRRGIDFAKRDILLKANRVLTARDVGLAAAANRPNLAVRRRPRVAILATGDELVMPGNKARGDQIFASNGFSLAALVHRFGGEAFDLGVVGDDLRATMRAISRGRGADVLITIGGASVGDHDLVQEALKRSGIALDFWKIAMRPGKPLMFARKGAQRIVGLPGNPVSALVCARIFIKPLLCGLLGIPGDDEILQARLAVPLSANEGRQDYMRAHLKRGADGGFMATPFPTQDSSMQRTLAEAGCLIIRPPNAPAAPEGAMVAVLPLDF